MQTWQLPGNRKEKRNILMDSKRRLQKKKKGIERWYSENSVGILEKPAFRRSGVTGVSGIIPEIASIFFHESLNDVKSESTQLSGEGNGNSLQYSCLGKPLDRGAWRAAALSIGSQRVRHAWAAERACTRPSPSHRPFPPSLSASIAPERAPWKATQASFPGAFSHSAPAWPLLTVTPGRGCPLRSLRLCCVPPSLARLPSASQPRRHHLPSLFTPAHSSHTVSDVRHSERRGPHRCPALTSFPCSTSHGPPTLSSWMSPWYLKLKGFTRELSPPRKICFCHVPSSAITIIVFLVAQPQRDRLSQIPPPLCSLDSVIKLFCLSSISQAHWPALLPLHWGFWNNNFLIVLSDSNILYTMYR